MSIPSRAELVFHCRRGMLELDLILTRFVNTGLNALTDRERAVFAALLEYSDPELYAYLMNQAHCPDVEIARLVDFIRNQNHLENLS